MPACRTSLLSYKSHPAPAFLNARRRSHSVFSRISSGAGTADVAARPSEYCPAPLCRHTVFQSCCMNFVWRQHAVMPDVAAMSSESRHEIQRACISCRDSEDMTPTSGMSVCLRRARCRGYESHIRHTGAGRDTEGVVIEYIFISDSDGFDYRQHTSCTQQMKLPTVRSEQSWCDGGICK